MREILLLRCAPVTTNQPRRREVGRRRAAALRRGPQDEHQHVATAPGLERRRVVLPRGNASVRAASTVVVFVLASLFRCVVA